METPITFTKKHNYGSYNLTSPLEKLNSSGRSTKNAPQ